MCGGEGNYALLQLYIDEGPPRLVFKELIRCSCLQIWQNKHRGFEQIMLSSSSMLGGFVYGTVHKSSQARCYSTE